MLARVTDPSTSSSLQLLAVSLAADGQAARAVGMLEAAGIPALVLKGASLAEWLYGKEIRSYSDADVMVSPDSFEAAEVALERGGYSRKVDDLHASAWLREGDPIAIDLHRRLWVVGSSPRFVWRLLWGRSVVQEIGGRRCRVLDPVARALVVALHQAHHHALGQDTTRTAADLRRLLDQLSTDDWRAVADLTSDLRATLNLAAGLRSVDDPRAAAIADELRLPDARLVERATQPDAIVPLIGAMANIRFARGPRRKLRALRQEIVPPADELRDKSRLARRGRGGLAVAYVLAPFWSLARFPVMLAHLRKLAAR